MFHIYLSQLLVQYHFAPSIYLRLVKPVPKKGLTSIALLHTSNCVLETSSIYAVADFTVISILLFPPSAREDLHHEDQQQGDGWVGVG